VQIYIDLIWPIAVINLVIICHFWLIQRSIVVDGYWWRSEYDIEGEQLQTIVKKAQFIVSKASERKFIINNSWQLLYNVFTNFEDTRRSRREIGDELRHLCSPASGDCIPGVWLTRLDWRWSRSSWTESCRSTMTTMIMRTFQHLRIVRRNLRLQLFWCCLAFPCVNGHWWWDCVQCFG
jgi:hypothetical protein